MGIEPTRAPPPELENKWFRALADPKCDWGVNFRGMWDHVGLRRDTSVGEVPGSSLPAVGLLPAEEPSHVVERRFRLGGHSSPGERPF
jgi:hypothetical protein